MDVDQVTDRPTDTASPKPGPAAASSAPHPAPAPGPATDGPLGETDSLNALAKVVLALVPALTVALAAVGSATGGLARLFRDQTGMARASVALVFLSFALAALVARARLAVRLRAGLLLLSTAALFGGIAWAFDAQIAVMGTGQAPVVTGAVTPGPDGAALDARVVATGVKSSSRIVVFAYEASDEHGDVNSRKVPLYYSKTGPDADGRVDLRVAAAVPAADQQQFPYVFVTAVLGEERRDCDGVLLEGRGPSAPNGTACLTLQRPSAAAAGPAPAPASPPSASPPSASPSSAGVTDVDVPGTASWTSTGVQLVVGQAFAVHASGSVGFIAGAPPVGPSGAADRHPGVCVLPGAEHHAGLIGRIGPSGRPFLVGADYEGVAKASGELALGINDTGVDNNSGAFRASIQLA